MNSCPIIRITAMPIITSLGFLISGGLCVLAVFGEDIVMQTNVFSRLSL